MKKPEQQQWIKLKAATEKHIMWQRHEDRLSPDIPDLSFQTPYGGGWVEMKTLDQWPARSTTAVNLPHLKEGQVNWLQKRRTLGSNCWILLWVRSTGEWLLFAPAVGKLIRERKLTREALTRHPLTYQWEKTPDGFQLADKLIHGGFSSIKGVENVL